MKQYKALFLLLFLTFLISSCATIFSGIDDDIIINSSPQGASIEIDGKNYGTTPLNFNTRRTIFRSKVVTLKKENYETETFKLKRQFNYYALLDVLVVGYPLAVDIVTGAIIHYKPLYYSKLLPPVPYAATNNDFAALSEDHFVWSKDVRPTWSLFAGKITDKNIYDNFSVAAVTYSDLSYSWTRKDSLIYVSSWAYMDTHLSWVKKESKTKLVLEHEQKHFDISEIYVRKFRKELEERTFKKNENIESEISAIYRSIHKRYMEAQYSYDSETAHGTNKEYQAFWNDMIEKQLKESEMFNNVKLYLKLSL